MSFAISSSTLAASLRIAQSAAQKPLTATAPASVTGSDPAATTTKSEDPQKALARALEANSQIAKSMKTARDDARADVKNRAKQTVERLKEEFKLIKKLWAHDPKQMAKQLARLAKELKSALADYADAAKANGDRVETSIPEQAAAAAPDADKAADKTAKPATDETAKPEDDVTAKAVEKPAANPEATAAVSAYARQQRDDKATEQKDARMEARGDLDFAQQVRGFVKKIREALQEAKIRSAFDSSDPAEKAKLFKDADKALKEVDEDLTDMESDIKADFPGLNLAIPDTVAALPTTAA